MNNQNSPSTTNSFEATVVSRKIPVGRQLPAKVETTIEVEKDADQITKIVIRCGCGEEIIVHCKYPAAA